MFCLLQRNQFLEAESVEMEKERNQIRSDMSFYLSVTMFIKTFQ